MNRREFLKSLLLSSTALTLRKFLTFQIISPTVFFVSNEQEFMRALENAKSGDTIQLLVHGIYCVPSEHNNLVEELAILG